MKNRKLGKQSSSIIVPNLEWSPSQRKPGLVFQQKARPDQSKVHSLGKATFIEHPLCVSTFWNITTFYKLLDLPVG